jgi:hypothetical protein
MSLAPAIPKFNYALPPHLQTALVHLLIAARSTHNTKWTSPRICPFRTATAAPGHHYLQLASQRRTSTTLPVLAIATRTSTTIKAHSIYISPHPLSSPTAISPQTSNIHIDSRLATPALAPAIETQHSPTHNTTTACSAVYVSSTTTMATTIKMQRVCCRLIAVGLWGGCIGRCRGGWGVKWVGCLGGGKEIRGWEARFSRVLLEKLLG